MDHGIRATALALTLAGALAAPASAQTVQDQTAQPLSEALGDPAAGRALYQRDCGFCHQIGEGAENGVGPHLNRIFDRGAGAVEGARYSPGMLRMGRDGLRWTYETLDAYLANPRALVSGTRMSYRGLRDEQQRHDVIAFLRQYSDQPQNIPESAPTALRAAQPALSAATLAIVGDPAYGEYLSGECATCHQLSGANDGIPSITGWHPEDFVVAMHAYRQELRPPPVMQMMAQRLDEEQIAALAAYFATLGE